MKNPIESIRLVLREDAAQPPPATLEEDAARVRLLRWLGARRMRVPAERAFYWWPTLEKTAVALAMHLGDVCESADGVPLAYSVVAKAVQAFGEKAAADEPMADAATAFLVQIVRVVDALQRSHMYVQSPDGQLVWNPFEVSYPEWLRRVGRFGAVRRSAGPLLVPGHPWAAQRKLATLTMVDADFELLFRERGH